MSEIIDSGEATAPVIEDITNELIDTDQGDVPKAAESKDGDKKSAEEKNTEEPSKQGSTVNIISPLNVIRTIEKVDPDDKDVDEDDDDFEDETIVERLIGLTEMFPETLRNLTWTLGVKSINFTKGFYEFSRSAVWILATSSIILAVPTLIESEKSQLDEMNRQQQRQILLGPSASGPAGLTPTLSPSIK